MMGGCLAMMGVRVGSRVAAVDDMRREWVERFDAVDLVCAAFDSLDIWMDWLGGYTPRP